jgi:hypothetical protein
MHAPSSPHEHDGVLAAQAARSGGPSQRRNGSCASEDALHVVGCSIMVLCWLASEWPGLKTENSAHCWSKLSAYYSVAMPRKSFSWQYTMPTSLVEGADKVSKSATTASKFWLALAKVGRGVSSWLVAAVIALARAWALVKLMVVARSVPCVSLCR